MIEQLIDLLLNYVEPDGDITADTLIKTELGMSSFDLICLADDISASFGVKLTADDYRNCGTVGKLAEFIESNAK